MAVLRRGEECEGPMGSFLAAFMHRNRDPPDSLVSEERERFARACGVLRRRIGTLRLGGEGGGISPPVLDAVFAAVAGDPGACDDPGLPARLRALLSDPEFVRCTTHAPGVPQSVRGRLALAKKALCA